MPSATLADRQLAAALIGAEVVGGIPIEDDGDGTYFLQVPDDGTGAQLWGAVKKLESLPQVDVAAPLGSSKPNQLQSGDSAGWRNPGMGPDHHVQTQEARGPVTVLELTCRLSFSNSEQGDVHCGEQGAGASDVSRSDDTSASGEYAGLVISNLARDTAAQSWTFMASVENLLAQPIGTLDGTTGVGSRMVVTYGPVATRGKGDVWITNADGTADITQPNQPYFDYPWIVQPQQISPNRELKLHVPNTVTEVTIGIAISTDFPATQDVAITPPDSVANWLYADSMVVPATSNYPLSHVKNVVLLMFDSSSSLSDRQLAVAKVGGEVVGGVKIVADNGLYVVRVSPSPPDDLFSIIDVLRTLPHVTSATPDNLLPLDTLGADLDPSVDHGSSVTQMQPDTGSAKPEVAPERIAAFHEAANAVTVLRFNCTLSFSDAEKGEIRCGVPGAATTSAERSVIVPWHSEYANWLASNLVRDSASETWSFRAGIQNLLAQPIGTLDGTSTLGSRMVVTHGPIATRGTGDVWITNADGVADFTAPNQPYFDCPWIVQPRQVSPYRQFELHVPNTVTEVTLGIAIPTKFPAMSSVAALPPDTTPAWFDDDTSWVRGGMLPDGFLRNIVSVLFERGTYLADRQAAVALVGGHVVGGTRFSGGDGYYYLFIRDDGTGAQLREAARKLAALPQVEVAVLQMRAYPADRARSN